MNAMTTLIFLLVAAGQQSTESTRNDQAAKAKSQRLLELHTDDAASFSIYRDPKRTQKLELRREPAYRWTNPTRVGGQIGEVFLWTYCGRPEIVGSMSSIRSEENTFNHDAKHTFRFYQDRFIPEIRDSDTTTKK
jgi:hypothetical protein